MPNTKTATLALRIDPELKEALKIAAVQEYRSIANMVEVLILNYCNHNQIPLDEQFLAKTQTDSRPMK